MHLVRKAIDFGMEHHKGQVRKVTGIEYFVHCICVYSTVKKYKESKNIVTILCAALLHDILEDTTVTYDELVNEFTKDIADLVVEVTNNKEDIAAAGGKTTYMKDKLLKMSSYALVIKLADMLDNITDQCESGTFKRYCILVQHVEAGRELSRTHKKIIREIKDNLEELNVWKEEWK